MNNETRPLNEMQAQPHDTDTEDTVLATLMRYNEKYAEYSDMLKVDLFYWETEKAIYRCIEGVINGGGITDINSLYNYAQSHDVGTNLEKTDFLRIFQMVSTQTLEQDIMRLRDFSRRRMGWLLLQQAAQRVLDVTNDTDEELNAVMTGIGTMQSEMTDGRFNTYGDGLQELEDIMQNNSVGKKVSLNTGFKLFDNYYLLRPSTLTVIAAFTGVGKSSLALNIAMSVARQNIPVVYYSLEMGKAELVSRSVSKELNLPANVIMNQKLSQSKRQSFEELMKRDMDLPIFFDDRSTVSFDRTIRSIRTMVKAKGVKLAIIDYLQIYAQVYDDVEQSISYMARAAKNIAKELDIAVLLLSQMNRSAPHPSIKMLRGSGQIEESADNIVLIDRPDAYPDNKVTKYEGEFKEMSVKGTAKLILAKGRGVGVGSALVRYDGAHTQFFEQEEQPEYKEQDEPLPF